MRKSLIAAVMAGVILFGSIPESTFAETTAAEGEIVSTQESYEATDHSIDDTAGTDAFTEELLKKAGGFIQPEYHEAEYGSLSEIYEEDEDDLTKGSAVYQHPWDSYSSNYYYNQLNSNEKTFWDQLDSMCLGYLTGTDTISSTQDKDGKTVYPTKSVIFSNMSGTKALNTALMFKYSNPQYYFLDISVYGSTMGTGGIITLTVFPAFANGTARAAATSRMQSVIDTWMPQINAQPTELLKEKKAHDLICEKVSYDPGYDTKSDDMNEYNQVAYSVFCTDTTVCAGYSQAMQLLMNAAGIDCSIVTSGDHEWNIVRIQNIWYYTDLTWDDFSTEQAAIYGQGVGYKYFNRSNQAFMNDSARLVRSHTPESMWTGYLPELVYDSGATWTDAGTVSTPSVTLTAPQIVCNQDTISMSAPSGGTIYYTTDGTNPSIAYSRAAKYTGAFTITAPTTIKAVAVANGYFDSTVTEVTAIPQYVVSFNANGGYIGNKSVTNTSKTAAYGESVGRLLSPKRKNYVFLGWYTKASGGSRISAATPVSGSTTYYAHWAKIKPVKASISYAKSTASKTMKVKIKKISSASGYVIRYSLNKNMKSAKKKTISKTAGKISKLKKKKTYYVQVRMYQKDSATGKKKYGAWSKIKTVKIK